MISVSDQPCLLDIIGIVDQEWGQKVWQCVRKNVMLHLFIRLNFYFPQRFRTTFHDKTSWVFLCNYGTGMPTATNCLYRLRMLVRSWMLHSFGDNLVPVLRWIMETMRMAEIQIDNTLYIRTVPDAQRSLQSKVDGYKNTSWWDTVRKISIWYISSNVVELQLIGFSW